MTPLERSARLTIAATFATSAAFGLPAAPATATATPSHVAIVVAGVGAACVPAGGTGLSELESRYDVLIGSQPPYVGFVLKINGIGTGRPDDTHYWAYYHDTGSGWSYSGDGAGTFHPQPGTIEGWAFDAGSDPAPRPPATTYAAVCAGQDKTTAPIRTSHTRPVPAQSTSAARRTQTATRRAGLTQGSPSAALSGVHTSSSGASASSPPAAARPSSAHAPVASIEATKPDDSAVARALPPAPPVSRHSADAFPAWGTALGLTAVAVIGGAAYWRARKQRA